MTARSTGWATTLPSTTTPLEVRWRCLPQLCRPAGRYQLDLNSYGADPLVTNEATSFDARIGALGQNRVNRNWNGAAGQSIGMGIAAVMSTVNFNWYVQTLVNPHGRPLQWLHAGAVDSGASQRAGAQAGQLLCYHRAAEHLHLRHNWRIGRLARLAILP